MAMFQTVPSRPESATLPQTVIGSMVKVTGNISSEGDVRIDGVVEKGEVAVKGRLEIGRGARVKGNVSADSLEVAGTIEGNVKTSGDIHVSETGKVNGDITTGGNLVIMAGGVLVGKSMMGVGSGSNVQVDLDVTELGTKTNTEELSKKR